MLKYKVITKKSEWDDVLSEFKEKDIYFEYNYFNLYESEGERPMMVYMKSSLGKVAYPFMLRDIAYHPSLIGKIENNRFFDITSPFGYNGPLINAYNREEKNKLIELFYTEFSLFCREYNIVSEFIKFSPILKNHEDMDSVVTITFLKKMLATNLDSLEQINKEIRHSRKVSIKKSRRVSMRVEFIHFPKTIDEQIKLYNDTMKRKNASDAFLFKDEYFYKIINNLSDYILLVNIKLEEELVAFGICFLSNGIIYAHVAGADEKYLKYSPYNISYADTINWGYENGYKYFFLGGGLSSSEEDSLYLYKKSFSEKTHFKFYTGKKIWNQRDYDFLVSVSSEKAKENKGFFPQYREY